MGMINPNQNTPETYQYYYQNLQSISSDPYFLISLLSPETIKETVSKIHTIGPFEALKYQNITNPTYTQPINPNSDNLVPLVTSVVSERLQINPSEIEYAVNQLTDPQLISLLNNINNYPRLRTGIIKLGYNELDLFVTDSLMTTKFQMVKRFYVEMFEKKDQKEANEVFSRVLLDKNMKEYSPVFLEMNYQPFHINNSLITNINNSKVPAMKPIQDFIKLKRK